MIKSNHIKPIAKDKCVPVRVGVKEVHGKSVNRRTEMPYKAQFPGKSAQDDKAQVEKEIG